MSLTTKTMPTGRVWGRFPLSHNGPLLLSLTSYREQDGVWTSCVSPIAPGPGLCLLSPHNGQTRINVRSFSQQSAPSDMNHIPVAWPPSSLYRVWKIKWEAVCHPVHVAWGINRFVIEHILVYLCGEFKLCATNLPWSFPWKCRGWLLEVNKVI